MSHISNLLRNVAIAGHGGTGKTTLLEHILFSEGVISKPETVESGRTVSDYYEEEIARKISVHSSLAHVFYKDYKINFIDTPGSSDFIGEVIPAFRSCEMALLVVDSKSGVQIETIKLWRNLDSRKKPRAIFLNKLDEDRSDFFKALEDIKTKFNINPVAVTFPMGSGADFKGVIDVLHEIAYMKPVNGETKETSGPVPVEFKDVVTEVRGKLCEAAAEGDDELMEKYLTEGNLTNDEMLKGLQEAFAQNRIVPVFVGSALKNSGPYALVDFLTYIGPHPEEIAKEHVLCTDGTSMDLEVDMDKPFSALVVKTQIDQFSGRMSYVKVFTGKLVPDMEIFNVNENKKEKISKIYTAQGKKLEEVKELHAGDFGIITKAPSLKTNDTLLQGYDKTFTFHPLRLPTPVHLSAISAVNKKEEDKLSELMLKVAEEDKTFVVNFNSETKETVIAGMGELQVNMILDKIKNQSKIAYETRIPRIAYRETITKKSGAEYTHKKQTGGHGQYGKVVLEVENLARGKNYEFVNAIFGGAVSRGFIPGIEKGLHEAMDRGVLAGYPVVDVKVTLTDGKEHPVDSSELSFKLAARGAFREAMKLANPTLLEPIMNLIVFVEETYLGDVMSDLSSRRGKISGQSPVGGGIVEIDAQVPQSELLRYAIDLKAMTSGTGSFTVDFDHYSPISGKIAEDVIKHAQTFKGHEEEEE